MSQYIDKKTVNASYRPKSNVMSPGLKRAREPYRIRNAITGLALGTFAVGIWAYSISAVKQDVFDDIDEEARELAHTRSTPPPAVLNLETEKKIMESAAAVVGTTELTKAASPNVLDASPPTAVDALLGRGLWVNALNGLLDPKRKTLVWGAPSVDNIGRMQLRQQTDVIRMR